MLNISQITNFDNLPIEGEYKVFTFPSPAIKLGYCGDALSIGKNIIITIEGTQRTFEIGKTGMFEFQPEVFKNINDTEAEEKEIKVYATEVRFPAGSTFVLDYCYET